MTDTAILEDVLSGLEFDIECESKHNSEGGCDPHPAQFIEFWTCGCPAYVCTGALMRTLNSVGVTYFCNDCGSRDTRVFRYEPIKPPNRG